MTNLHNPEIDNDPREFEFEDREVLADFDKMEDVIIGTVTLPIGEVLASLYFSFYFILIHTHVSTFTAL